MSKSGSVDAPGRMTAPGALNPARSGAIAGNRSRPRGIARHAFDEVDAGVEPIAFVAAEEERLVLHERPADRSAELILFERRLRQMRAGCRSSSASRTRRSGRTRTPSRGRLLVPDLVTTLTWPPVPVPYSAGIVARLDAELLDVLEARLQLERRRDLAVQIAGRGVDDRRALDAVVANRVLLDRAAAEPDVLPGAGAGVHRARAPAASAATSDGR